jgi:hypothetical protein
MYSIRTQMPGKPELPRFQRLFGLPNTAILPGNRDACFGGQLEGSPFNWRELRSGRLIMPVRFRGPDRNRLVESLTPLSRSLRRKVYVTQPIGGAFNPDFSPASTPHPPTASAFLFRYILCLGSCRLPSANLLHCLKARLACVFLWVACSNSGLYVGLSSVRALISFI